MSHPKEHAMNKHVSIKTGVKAGNNQIYGSGT
jgi:hypothetical protein